MRAAAGRTARAGNLPGLVDEQCAARRSTQRAEVRHDTILPEERVRRPVGRWLADSGAAPAHDLSPCVHARGPAPSAPEPVRSIEGAEIDDLEAARPALREREGCRGLCRLHGILASDQCESREDEDDTAHVTYLLERVRRGTLQTACCRNAARLQGRSELAGCKTGHREWRTCHLVRLASDGAHAGMSSR